MMKPGTRVGAISGKVDDCIEYFGYGVYEGEYLVDRKAGGLASFMWAAYDDPESGLSEEARKAILLNPKIRLDNGDIIWGCECWWAPEEHVKKMLMEAPKIWYRCVADIRAEGKS